MDLEDSLNLDPNLPKWGTSDNASNMVKAINMSNVELYCCLNHTQQLAIQDALKAFKDTDDGETMADIAEKCKKLADHVKRADVSRKLLFDECEECDHYPKMIPVGNDTRWDSTLACMEGVAYHEECLLRLARKGQMMVEREGVQRKIIPSISNFLMIKAGIKILKHCQITTKVFEQEKVRDQVSLLCAPIKNMFEFENALSKSLLFLQGYS